MPTILQINTSPGGVPKRPILEGYITPLGLVGDSCAHPKFHGGPNQAILIIAAEALDYLKERGFSVFAGALGENLTTEGLDPAQLRLGHQLRAGQALLEITKVRVPCNALDPYGPGIQAEIYDKQVKAGDASSPRWGLSGFYCRVLREGAVRPGDPIEIVAALA